MSRAAPMAGPSERRQSGILVFCRDLALRAELERALPEAKIFASPVEGMLAVVRGRPAAVLFSAQDVEGREADLVQSLRRAHHDLRIYVMVWPEAEPLGRRLVRSGAAGYVVVPGDIGRLPQRLEARR